MRQIHEFKNVKIEVHKYDKVIESVYGMIRRELSESNVALISRYDKELVRLSIAKSTRLTHLRTLLSLTRLLKKDWKDVTKSDIDELVFEVMRHYADESGQETYTSYDHKKILKIFFRWFKLGSREFTEVGDPPETQHVKMRKVRDKIVREDLITESDRTRLLHACGENARDRAFLDCHKEGGTRPGEILNLSIKHVIVDKYGAILHVDGKTGPRPVRLVRSRPSLAAWLAVHPFRDNPDAPLWIKLDRKNYGKPMSYSAARQMVVRRCEMAHISKRVYLNLFRHSEATEAANFMTEAQMKQRHGWSKDSKMPGRYVHLVGADVEAAIFEHYGIAEKKGVGPAMAPRACHVCGTANHSDSNSCSRCGTALDLGTAVRIDDANEARLSAIEETLKVLLNALPK